LTWGTKKRKKRKVVTLFTFPERVLDEQSISACKKNKQ
jgi:hypothetical protein